MITDASDQAPAGLPNEGLLRWRCRRGMRELDAALVAYLDNHYKEAAVDEKAAFCALLDMPDPDIMRLVAGQPSASKTTIPEPAPGPLASAMQATTPAASKSALQGSIDDEDNKAFDTRANHGTLQSNPSFVRIVEKIRTTLIT